METIVHDTLPSAGDNQHRRMGQVREPDHSDVRGDVLPHPQAALEVRESVCRDSPELTPREHPQFRDISGVWVGAANELVVQSFGEFHFSQMFHLLRSDPRTERFGLYVGPKIVAQTLAVKQGGRASLAFFCVTKMWRGRGYGRRLYEEMVRHYGCPDWFIEARDEAIDFWRKLGFHQTKPNCLIGGLWHASMESRASWSGPGS